MNETLPPYEQIVALHKKYAPSDAAFDLVFTHCLVVWDIAKQLIEKTRPAVDADFIKAACLLHDIGVYQLYLTDGKIDHANYIKHGIHGYDILKNEGFSNTICRVASHHTGVGLSAKHIEQTGIPLPVADYFAESVEERLVMYADKFHTKTTPPKLMTNDTYRMFTSRFGMDNVERFERFEQEFGVPDLELLAHKYNLEIS